MKSSCNAIILAAGLSTRFVPLSLEKPKALLTVKGNILIERQIVQLKEAGIEEIVLVVGYLKEQFEYLKEKYGVILVENPYYQTRNNHSSLYAAREYLGNTFICSGDNYFEENVFLEKSEKSYYAAVYIDGRTNEWCFQTNEADRITDVTIGGENAWTMRGQAYVTKEFSEYLKPFLVQAMEMESAKGKFWENIYMEHVNELDMFLRKYKSGIIEEFDSLEELRAFDKAYVTDSHCSVIEDLSKKLGCTEEELEKFRPLKRGEEVSGFTFMLREKEYQFDLEKGLL